MRSLLMLVGASGALGFVLWWLECALEASRRAPERIDVPHIYLLRRRRSDGPSTLFLDTPAFRRRLQAGWGADDRGRVPR